MRGRAPSRLTPPVPARLVVPRQPDARQRETQGETQRETQGETPAHDQRETESPAAPAAATPVASAAGASARVRLTHPVLVQLPAILAVGGLLALVTGAGPRVTLVALLGVVAVRCRPGIGGTGLLRVPSRLAVDVAVPIGLVAASVAILPTRVDDAAVLALRQGLLLVVAGNLAAGLASRVVRRLGRTPRLVVVSDRSVAAVTTERWTKERPGGRDAAQVVGSIVLDDTGSTEPVGDTAVARTVEEVVARVVALQADLVVVVPGSDLSAQQVRRLSWRLEHTGVGVALAGLLDAVAPHRLRFGSVGGTTVVLSGSTRPGAGVRAAKWVFDRVGAALLLLPALPVLAVAAVAIRLDSTGPAFYRQERIGRGGVPFTMVKLRTMHTDADARLLALGEADEAAGPLFKIRRDPRITRVGALLRKSSLDELPQLFNVLRGDMSLVGPRPALPREVATYDDHVARRLVVRPGMTGLWQVSGRSDLDWAESVELDLHYADNYRLTDDLLIGLRTVEAVARARGAY